MKMDRSAVAVAVVLFCGIGARAFHVGLTTSVSPLALSAPRATRRMAAASPWVVRPSVARARALSAKAQAKQGEAEAGADAATEAPAGDAAGAEAAAEKEAAPDPAAELKQAVANLENQVFAAERRLSAARESVKEKGKTGFLRIAAEVDNYRKRRGADKTDLERRAMADIVKAFVPVLDAFEAAQAELELTTEEETKYANSYRALESQLKDELTKLGMAPFFAAQSEKFDSKRHEKAEERHSEEFPAGTVMECWANGLEVAGNVAKKALCVVSLGKEGAAAAPEGEAAEDMGEGAVDAAGEEVETE